METRVFNNLTVDGEDLIIAGDIKIYGILTVNNANLIVSGAIQFGTFVTTNTSINITNGSISAEAIIVGNYSTLNIFVENGDIYVADVLCASDITLSGGGSITVCYNLDAENIFSDGDIVVGNDASVIDVTCFNYLVSGKNDSNSIVATQDIYILGDSDSLNLQARDIFIAGSADFNDSKLTAFGSVHIEDEIRNCASVDVGR